MYDYISKVITGGTLNSATILVGFEPSAIRTFAWDNTVIPYALGLPVFDLQQTLAQPQFGLAARAEQAAENGNYLTSQEFFGALRARVAARHPE